MCVVFIHVLHQPWWTGADWYHHHLIDSDVGVNCTQCQSQADLIEKPSQRVYNPRKQARDHDADGVWTTQWVPELQPLPSQFLARPERTPLAIQQECGVTIGADYPSPSSMSRRVAKRSGPGTSSAVPTPHASSGVRRLPDGRRSPAGTVR